VEHRRRHHHLRLLPLPRLERHQCRRHRLSGENVIVPIDFLALDAPPIRVRQTIRVGDDCATAVLRCTLASNGNSLKYTSAP
jgi:hypothetical protein